MRRIRALLLPFILLSCGKAPEPSETSTTQAAGGSKQKAETTPVPNTDPLVFNPQSAIRSPQSDQPRPEDFVELVSLDSTFVIDIRYATENNFMKRRVYPVAKAYLRREAAEALVRVQGRLRPQGAGIKVWDAYRPLSVQKILWSVVPDDRFVADPKKGSKHNRGAAVDVTLVDLKSGREMEMPTGYDDFTERAQPDDDRCSPAAKKNRALLQEAMTAEGFQIIDHEWWHFDYRTWKKFEISDHPIQ